MLILKRIVHIDSLEINVCSQQWEKYEKTVIFKECICACVQLPLVLDNHSEGIDIRLWVRVISAVSDRLLEVRQAGGRAGCPRPGPIQEFTIFSSLYLAARKQLLPLARVFTQTQTVGGYRLVRTRKAKSRTGL